MRRWTRSNASVLGRVSVLSCAPQSGCASTGGILCMMRFPASIAPLIFAVALGSAGALGAQDLPTVRYTSQDGLVNDSLHTLLQDPAGLLWIGGSAAVNRFDGERFIAYGSKDGLDIGTGVNHLAVDEHGDLWIATNGGGIHRLDRRTTDKGRFITRFKIGESRASNRVNVIQVLEGGRIWAGTDAGLFVGDAAGRFERVPLAPAAGVEPEGHAVVSIAQAGAAVWVGTPTGAYRCTMADARCTLGRVGRVRSMLIDRQRRVWIARERGVERWSLDADGSLTGAPQTFINEIEGRRLAAGFDGALLTTEDRQVISIAGDTARVLFTLTDVLRVNDIVEDQSRNLWLATTSGLVGIRRQGVTLFSAYPRLAPPHLLSLRTDAKGRPFAFAEGDWIHRIEGDRVTSVHLLLPDGVRRSIWAGTAVQIDSGDDIWLGTNAGLYRFARPQFSDPSRSVRPSARYSVADGLASDHVAELFEDSRGDLWIAGVPGGGDTLTVWRRASGRFERMGEAQGLPKASQLGSLIEDANGAVWARLREGGLVRVRGGRATLFGPAQGVPAFVAGLMRDRSGRLWVTGADVIARIDDPAAEVIRAETVAQGLGSMALSLVEHESGVFVVGTYEGLFLFHPERRQLTRYAAFEGLPRGTIDMLAIEPDGNLLASAGRRIARIVLPPRAEPARALTCVVSSLRIGNRDIALPERGMREMRAVELAPAENRIEIGLTGVSSRLGEPLTYEYRLRDVSDTWTRAPDRRISYAGLAAGRYRFEARTVSGDGATLSEPAVLAFRVLPPWYRRWWFVSLVSAAGLLAAYAAHQARLGRAVQTERLRSRIATDLHDDIGSSLSQIAILAEVARRRAGASHPGVAEPLSSIATTSRDLVDAMSDIVWAVNPRTDSLGDLTRRMHRFAEETLGGADIGLKFSAPPEDTDLKIGADLRRELYLILKESVNNIARHSGASAASIELSLRRNELRLEIADNGRGFDPGAHVDGNGIASMRKRAAAFGGRFSIDSAPGQGSRVSLSARLRGGMR